jgi:arabinofuranosyltransferase
MKNVFADDNNAKGDFVIDQKLVLLLLVVLFTFVVFKNAWVSDDALITFRTIENFLSGYGLTFNISERVQTYTHPLWMFLQAGIYFLLNRVLGISFWAELFYLNIVISLTLSVLVVIILVFKLARSFESALLGMSILIMSKAFVDYSTSGLENPLTHLLLVVFFYIYLKDRDNHSKNLGIMSLIAALSALNRLDSILLYLPALGYAFWQVEDKKKGLISLALGFTPVLVWELFSIYYYGFLFPNTAYAKLNIGVGFGRLARQGLYYYLNSLSLDHLTLLTIVLAIVIGYMNRHRRHIPMVIGVMLYLLYIIRIGGGFMSGRFFAAPLLICVILLSRYRLPDARSLITVMGIVLILGLTSPRPPIMVSSHPVDQFELKQKTDERGITDERLFYFRNNGLLVDNRSQGYPGSMYAGRQWVVDSEYPTAVEIAVKLGFFGYEKGPSTHVIDIYSLSDALLSKLPTIDPEVWNIGHWKRDIPDGYLETLASGENQIIDIDLANYYDRLTILIKGDLGDGNRLLEIWHFNTGKYDPLLNAYILKLPNY